MITPQFKITQDEEFVRVQIRAPYIKATDMQFVVTENQFTFALSPYYLRLRFSGNLVDDDERTETRYVAETSIIEVKVPKETKGEEFTDLDMVSKLLATKSEFKSGSQRAPTASKPMIEEIGGTSEQPETLGDEEIDWEVPQEAPPAFDTEDTRLGPATYGFDNKYSGVVGDAVQEDVGNDINEVWDPSAITTAERASLRHQNEELHFDADHYAADKYDNPMIEELLQWEPPTGTELSGDEHDRVARLARKTYVLTDAKAAYLGLVAILFGYAYDARTTQGEPTVESAWTVGKLCPYFACLDASFRDVRSVAVSCTRRSLVFPLYRHWELSRKVWDDVYNILRDGRPAILKALASLLGLFEQDRYAVYRRIWLEDYTVWIQHASDAVVRSLAHEVHKVSLSKSDVGLDLDEVEAAAEELMRSQTAD